MNRRRNLLAAGAAAALLAAALWPLSRWMTRAGDGALDAKQASAAAALEVQAAYEALEAGRAVEPMMAMEDAWAIEDTRAEAQAPLVTEMLNGRDVLGYDAESQTFYCTLGMETGEGWPELMLAARGARDVRVAWIDDYAYDACADAIAEGYRYELLAYTQTAYAYIGVVFTGLPIATLRVEDELGEMYVPGRMTLAAAGYEAVSSAALVHLRGGGSPLPYPKHSFRVEMHALSEKGKDSRREESLLGMEADADWLLIANTSDPTRALNHMGFGLWRDWHADGRGFALLESRMVEVFLGDAYMGLYQLMQRVDVKKEIERMGGSLDTDICMRILASGNLEGRPYINRRETCGYFAELRYKPDHMSVDRALALFEPYHRMNAVEEDYIYDDETFARQARAGADMRELMEYFIFAQIASFGYDNVFNNVYLWALRGEEGYVYYMSPWDMDNAFRSVYTDGSKSINLWHAQIVRMLNQNLDDCRAMLWTVWNEKKAALLGDDMLYQRLMDLEQLLNGSGAYRREALKWLGEDKQLNLGTEADYMISHRDTVEFFFRELWPVPDAGIE